MKNKFLTIAALSGLFTVAFGAFASHGLSQHLEPKALGWIETGIKYQMFHTIAILALGLFQISNFSQNPPACRAKALNIIGGSWALGILLFSGNLYLRALDVQTIHWLTPIGGLCFMLGWVVLIYVSVRSSYAK
ncbi:DUF423 domain-containing protein [Mannheimia sp. HC-2023]|uniref:DUF423 domain-containing protein n=1 Tax=Mannheimia indoligenes TaxID=3103145 RepID=UPI002FE6A8DD